MGSSSGQYRSRFGDTTLTKVFVGGLAWETPSEILRQYFDQFGEILEAVVITDKTTGRSKGYGFVTFREPESARSACVEPNPIIDGRRANCNIASQGLPRPPPGGVARVQVGINYEGSPQHVFPHYGRLPPPQSVFSPYGYMTYPPDYGYQQAVYNPQFQHQIYGGQTSPSRVGSPYPPYPYSPVGYTAVQISPRAGFPFVQHVPRPQQPPSTVFQQGYVQYPVGGHVADTSFIPSSSSHNRGFHLQAPPPRQTQTLIPDSNPTDQQQQQQQTSIDGASTEDKEEGNP